LLLHHFYALIGTLLLGRCSSCMHAPSTLWTNNPQAKARHPGSGILSMQMNKQRGGKDSFGCKEVS
jgi:hypothetical protein